MSELTTNGSVELDDDDLELEDAVVDEDDDDSVDYPDPEDLELDDPTPDDDGDDTVHAATQGGAA